ncbi:MAG TPA: tetratricopeptide repeat protein, partial [Candidatus Nitrosocosmicus sp.]|nr:tetratricopeptide repeat protein [Candidatus Nitrosocosmicus sp.]
NLGKLYHDHGEFKKAEAHYRAAAESAPKDPAPKFNLGVLLEDARQIQAARRAYQEAVELDPSFADAHYNLALLCESLDEKAEAVAHFHAARKLYLNK